MKLFEVQMSKDILLRNSIGRTVSAKGMASIMNKLYGTNFDMTDTTPYVRAFNNSLSGARDEKTAELAWKRLYQELSHPNKRPPPDE